MCGRVVQHRDLKAYAAASGFSLAGASLPNAPPHYNGAPTQELLVVRRHPKTGEKRLDLLRWGLIPHWADDPKIGSRLINARGEEVGRTRAFRDAYRQRRCLVPVDGFYEWQKVGKERQPYLITMQNGEPFTLAGLWENWKNPATGEWTRTFTIITTEANPLVRKLHDRMPVIIAPDDQERWLNSGESASDLLRPFPAERMRMWPVSRNVNSPKNDGPELIEPIPSEGVVGEGPSPMERANAAAPGPSNSE